MRDDDSIFGIAPDGLDRLVFEVWQNPAGDRDAQPTIAAQVFLEQPGECIGRYKLLSILGEGGMGVVYLAEQERPVRRQVALKVIKPGMDSKRVLARFEAEQQALALMEHPHVARVHDVGLTPSGRPYFVMEYVKGIPITEYCDKHRLTVEERLQLFLHVCEAVQHAHQKGVIHRDLKPSNILVTVEDAQATPKVIDFGVARAISQPLTERTLHTELGQLVGTPEYMSPEQADPDSRDIDTRTDVYSLGVILYELVAGVLPFDPHALREHGIDGARKVICEQDPQTPSTRLSRTSVEESTKSALQRRMNVRQLQRRLRGDLDWITLKAMEKDRTRRYPSAGDLAADVLRHLNNEPVTAGRPSPIYKAGKFVRRHRALVTGAAAVLIVLVAGIVASLTFAVRTQRARRETTTIAEFLQQDVFDAIDAWDRGGRQMTIKDVLDNASRKVADKFGSAPLTEAAIRQKLGALYMTVDAQEEAEDLLKRALEIFARELGPEAPQTLDVLDQLGQTSWQQWQYPQAVKYLSEALAGRRRLLGPDHPDTLKTMAWLGWSHYGNGLAGQAVSLLADACQRAEHALGSRHPLTVECMFYYGPALLFQGQDAEGQRVLADALQRSQGVLNPAHPFVIYPTALLGRRYSREGRYEQAEKLLRDTLDRSRDAWGEHHAATFHTVAALAENYARQGRIDEAEDLLVDALRRAGQTAGPGSRATVGTLPYLGLFYLWQRRYDEAELALLAALQRSIDCHGDAHPVSRLDRIALGMLYREQGRYDEADGQLAMPINVPDLGDTSVHVVNAMHQLAIVCQQQGRYIEAEALLLRILSARRKLLAENHPHTLGTIRGLIALYAAWDKPQEARRWFDVLMEAYAQELAASRRRPTAPWSVRHDPATDTYVPVAPPAAPWTIERELDFSIHEPTSEMWHVCDDLHFACKTLQGDGSIAAKIERIGPRHYATQTGLMIRSTNAPGAPYASAVVTPLGDVIFQCRTVELGAARSIYAIGRFEPPRWLRLTRMGNLFAAEHSGDGVVWEPIRGGDPNQPALVEIPFGRAAYVGFTVASCDPSCDAEVRISHITTTGAVSPSGPFAASDNIPSQLPAVPNQEPGRD